MSDYVKVSDNKLHHLLSRQLLVGRIVYLFMQIRVNWFLTHYRDYSAYFMLDLGTA